LFYERGVMRLRIARIPAAMMYSVVAHPRRKTASSIERLKEFGGNESTSCSGVRDTQAEQEIVLSASTSNDPSQRKNMLFS